MEITSEVQEIYTIKYDKKKDYGELYVWSPHAKSGSVSNRQERRAKYWDARRKNLRNICGVCDKEILCSQVVRRSRLKLLFCSEVCATFHQLKAS